MSIAKVQRFNADEVWQAIKHPAKVAIAIMATPDDKYNPIVLEWFTRTSSEPFMFAISIGHTRYSYECMQETSAFNLVFPTPAQKELVLLAGTQSGRETDKLQSSGVAWFKGRYTGLPVISDAAATFECELVTQIRSGDHTIYVGQVKYAWLNDGAKVILSEQLK
ncbi:MAG: flavin reductase family protein [Candidatus Cloacimonetes bacterium]|nr:flavin reductase family protein [Candidatus Cloacimonadota bacterium]